MNVFLEIISILLIIILSPVILLAGIFILFGIIALICMIIGLIIVAIDNIMEVFKGEKKMDQTKCREIYKNS